jgi:predicted hydrocarbon binding protein
MGRPGSRPAELALPVASLAAIRHSLTEAVGADEAARALRAAGHAAGDAVYAALTQPFGADPGNGREPAELQASAFWRRISQLFSTRGWGALNHSAVHDGVASLDSTNWVEAEPGTTSRPTCHFTTGLLANLLGQAAGADVAVLEVECRSQGDQQCRFVFGAPETIDAMYERIRTGASVSDSIAALV